jgi:hypothetical protein
MSQSSKPEDFWIEDDGICLFYQMNESSHIPHDDDTTEVWARRLINP